MSENDLNRNWILVNDSVYVRVSETGLNSNKSLVSDSEYVSELDNDMILMAKMFMS